MNTLFRTEYERTRQLVERPDWYLDFGRMRQARLLGVGAVQGAFKGSILEAAQYAKQQLVDIFEQLLAEHEVRLGVPGQDELEDQDDVREPITQAVIHHSSRAEGISVSQLNALHLLQLYVPRYRDKNRPVLNSKKQHQPIYSGHFDENGNQVFYGYHWKVQQDGSIQRLLADSAIGWHASNWAVNVRSVGICIDDDLENKNPTDEALEAVATILKKHYPYLPPTNQAVVGHNEASEMDGRPATTVCPGEGFLKEWKTTLLTRVNQL
ncbi:MAG: peptidoglycan recognition family protein [Candidatus Microsaccharimonas sp.]